ATLFGTELTVHDMIWTGPRPSLGDLAELSGIARTASFSMLAEHLGQAAKYGRIHYLKPYRADTAENFSRLLGMPLEQVGAWASLELTKAVIAVREIKAEEEIAELDAGFSLSFSSIATPRGEILHNHDYGAVCEEGQLFLLDAGAESESGYAGDLTTTFPVGQHFTSRQKEIYTILRAMMEAAIQKTGPGVRFLDVHLASARVLAQGLVDLGLYVGSPDEIVALGAHALLFPHGVGHMIGLDVHDMEGLGEDLVGYDDRPRSEQFGLRSLRLAKILKPGMTHTIEPGIYFIPGLFELWRSEKKFEHMIRYDRLADWMDTGGMRIEEDWLIMNAGARRLGPLLDKSIEAIEAKRRVMD
ncbi:MAG: M24 family metallopeptidase, partial [Spirochaetia bacterium]|nr:M24 family metallopeptidase [Spirochaetia bacterium]